MASAAKSVEVELRETRREVSVQRELVEEYRQKAAELEREQLQLQAKERESLQSMQRIVAATKELSVRCRAEKKAREQAEREATRLEGQVERLEEQVERLEGMNRRATVPRAERFFRRSCSLSCASGLFS
jgi:hypothetical protein